MERIKSAIEKARESASDAAAQVDKPHRGVAAPGNPPVADLEQIEYRNTRVVEIDSAILEDHRIIAHNKNDPRSGAFDLLRTQVVRKLRDRGWKTMAVTSPTPGCGKTLVAINLAMSVAQQTDQTVLLADFDLRRPKIADYLGLPAGPSLVDYVRGQVEIEEILVNPGIPRLVLLPNAEAVTNATELLTAPRVKQLVVDLKSRYESRIVIFDLPPLLASDDAIAFLPEVDCGLLVAANGHTTKSEIEESQRLLKTVELLGTVLNKSETRTRPYY